MSSAEFSAAQLRAITAADGPLAIVAGPGCGKTTVLAARVAFLIGERGFDPSTILVVSFTTEAARRLRREVARQLGDRAADVAILTLHALGRRVIDTWAIHLGYEDRPSVLHQDEARALLGSAADSLGWDLKAVPVDELASVVDPHRLLTDAESRQNDLVAPLAAAYEERLRRHGAIGFVAMLSLPLRLFTQDGGALRVLQDAYRWVLVDEGQDVDQTQWRLVELLAAQHGNLLVAGDDAQCIFRWRGADPHAMQRFVQHHPGANHVTLDKNHRSTSRLVQLSNGLAELLPNRSPLYTDNPVGPLPRLLLAEDEQAEAIFVAGQIAALLDRGLLPHPGEAAIVFRTRAQADALVGALRAAGLPYRLHGHADLFGTRVARDVIAYLRLAVNLADRAALAASLTCRAAGWRSWRQPSSRSGRRQPSWLPAQPTSGLLPWLPPVTLLDRALDRSGYRRWLELHPDGTRRLRLLGRLRGLAQCIEVSLAEWLDDTALGEGLAPGDEEAVRLSSMHTAKGESGERRSWWGSRKASSHTTERLPRPTPRPMATLWTKSSALCTWRSRAPANASFSAPVSCDRAANELNRVNRRGGCMRCHPSFSAQPDRW